MSRDSCEAKARTWLLHRYERWMRSCTSCGRFKMNPCRIPKGPWTLKRDKRNLDYELMLADIGSIEKRMRTR